MRPTSILLATATLVLSSATASAYTLKTTPDGQPLHWETDVVTLVADDSLAAFGPGVESAISAAFAAWTDVSGAYAPAIEIVHRPADELGYRADDANANTIRYAPEGYAAAGSALAITMVSFDATGKILDADVVINGGGSRTFGLLDPDDHRPVNFYDLQDVLTHEAGHLFGLAHNADDAEATMFPATGLGEIEKRSLTADDETGLRSLYPQPLPGVSCAIARPGEPGGPSSGSSSAIGTLVAAIALGVRARRHRRGPLGSV